MRPKDARRKPDPLDDALRLRVQSVPIGAAASPVGLVLFDLDGFKSVNDTHGHPAGDELLALVSHTLQALVRDGDAVARLGGDEFALILPGLDSAGASDVAARTRGALAERIEATVGIAAAPFDGSEPDALVRAADERLYAARASRQAA
jgi:diguanylate cyclase (GGDEF)-like protein